ncbi:hypothetical protein V3C99_012229 [Haemonchus contortus]|uniref:Transmembrane protein n=1 Tax=Haemonchus contortus TaxID=6289 RepID=A0A7I4Y395_HAECO
MCDALAELGEEGNEDYQVCSCLHSFIACLAFQVFDLFAVLITFAVYAIAHYYYGPSLQTSVPAAALFLFAVAFPTGTIGLLYERANLLVIYNTRISIIVIWSITWMIISMMSNTGTLSLAVALFWFLATVFYFWGLFVTSKALTYITTHYRGYDDVDPDRVQFIEQMLRNMIDEIKQRELDIAAGALPVPVPSVGTPAPEEEPDMTARGASESVQASEKGKRPAAAGSVIVHESSQSD